MLAHIATSCLVSLHLASAQHRNFQQIVTESHKCAASNTVLPRGDGVAKDLSATRPWTIHENTYNRSLEALPFCSSTEQLLASLKLGSRWHALTNLTDEELEAMPMLGFTPAACTYRWYTATDMCHILGRFSQVRLVGDSLMRHVAQALFMLVRNDLQYGALPLQLENTEVYDKCQCDGQFSEHGLCRVGHMMAVSDHRKYGLCAGLQLQPFWLGFAGNLGWSEDMCTRDHRPVLAVLGGGAHQESIVNDTIDEVVEPFMQELRRAQYACPHVTFHVAWMGMGVQSRSLDDKYPHQRRELILDFNSGIFRHLQDAHFVQSFDVWNLTHNAGTSDGFHYLSEVNMLKAMYILNYMDLISRSTG